jgi:hypothetical protein
MGLIDDEIKSFNFGFRDQKEQKAIVAHQVFKNEILLKTVCLNLNFRFSGPPGPQGKIFYKFGATRWHCQVSIQLKLLQRSTW